MTASAKPFGFVSKQGHLWTCQGRGLEHPFCGTQFSPETLSQRGGLSALTAVPPQPLGLAVRPPPHQHQSCQPPSHVPHESPSWPGWAWSPTAHTVLAATLATAPPHWPWLPVAMGTGSMPGPPGSAEEAEPSPEKAWGPHGAWIPLGDRNSTFPVAVPYKLSAGHQALGRPGRQQLGLAGCGVGP